MSSSTYRIGRFNDILPISQSSGLVLKNVNPTRQKHAKQEKKHTKNADLNRYTYIFLKVMSLH